MACPDCGCKTTYLYEEGDDMLLGDDRLYRCAASIFDGKEPTLQIIVRDNNIDQALKALKKKMQREGIFREMKLRGAYEKPSEKRARERAEAVRRYRKLQRKRMQREGLLPR